MQTEFWPSSKQLIARPTWLGKWQCLLVASIFVYSLSAASASQSLATGAGYSKTARALYRAGKLADCEKELQKNIEQAQKLGASDRRLSNALEDLATFYCNGGDYARAESLLERVLKIRRQTLWQEYPSISLTRLRLSKICELQGKYKRAEELLREEIAIKDKTLGAYNPKVALLLMDLARVYAEEGQLSPETAPKSLEIEEKLLQPADVYKRALEKAAQNKDANGLDLAESVNKLAQIYEVQGRWVEAAQLEERLQQMYKKFFKADDQRLLDAQIRLANDYLEDVKGSRNPDTYRQAESLLRGVLASMANKYGSNGAELVPILYRLADAEKGLKNYVEAIHTVNRALAIARTNKSSEMESESMKVLVYMYEERGQQAQTEDLLRKMLALSEMHDDPNKRGLQNTLYIAAQFYRNHGLTSRDLRKLDLSEQYYKRALEIEKKIVGPNSPEVTALVQEIAMFHRSREKLERELNVKAGAAAKESH